MLKLRKIFLSALTSIVLVFALSGCAPKSATPQIPFSKFIEELPPQVISSTDMGLEILFHDPLAYGFEDERYTLPYSTLEDYQEADQESTDLLIQIKAYDYETLSDKEKTVYDKLLDFFKRQTDTAKYYDYEGSNLGSFLGTQSSLPLLLTNFTYESTRDFDNYFYIINSTDETFTKYYELEKTRQEKGTGLTKTILQKVIEQCDNFLANDNSFINESFNKKVDALDYLDANQKAKYKSEHDDLISNKFIVAYQNLRDNLSTITATNEDDLGLASSSLGKDYYQFMIDTNIGIDMSVPEIKQYLGTKYNSKLDEVSALKKENPKLGELMLKLNNNEYTIPYTKATTAEGAIDYLKTAIEADYPPLDSLNYEVQQVPESMKDNYSPAAYFRGKIDANENTKEAIVLNGEFKPYLFNTIAHEGYPGHMYQYTYYNNQEPPVIMQLLSFTGYSEGWATYAENNVWRYIEGSEEDKAMAHLMSLQAELSSIVVAITDIGIHYEGWDLKEYNVEMQKYFGSTQTFEDQYYINLETPSNYLNYTLSGLLIQDMHDRAKKELKDDFSTKAFNTAVLNEGNCSMDLLNKRVDTFIKNTKK